MKESLNGSAEDKWTLGTPGSQPALALSEPEGQRGDKKPMDLPEKLTSWG